MAKLSPDLVNQLKRKMAMDKDISGVMKFFFDEFVDSPGFMSLGYEKELPDEVKTAVTQALAAGLGKSSFTLTIITTEIPEMTMIHGTVVVNGIHGAMVWATDLQTGIVGVPKKPGGPEMLYVRLSLTPPRTRSNVM